jgi:transposase
MKPTINPIYNDFEKIIGIELPYYISDIEFDHNSYNVSIFIDYHSKSLFNCECGQSNIQIHSKKHRIIRDLDIMNYKANIHIDLPIINCPNCRFKTVLPSWSTPRSGLTLKFQQRLLAASSFIPLSTVTKLTGESYDRINHVIKTHVEPAREKVDMSGVQNVGFDETSKKK